MRLALSPYIVLAGLLVPQAVQGENAPRIRAIGTELQITLPSGHVLAGKQLVGSVLSVQDPNGTDQLIRIDSIEADATDPDGDIQLHSLSVQDSANQSWSNFCAPGPDGNAKAFPLSGSWTGDGKHVVDDQAFSFICTGGAIGKCVRWGYKPWKRTSNGAALWDYHQACVRMVRADYGGDGTGHTRDDTPIDLFDRLTINPPASDPGPLTFEATWGVNGAICVRKSRFESIISLDELERRYPALRGKTGLNCSEESRFDGILILNRS
jgi:hypothetical protein